MATGKCLCGAVTYEIKGDPMMVVNCHCQRCRRMTGSSFESAMILPTDQIDVKSGKDNVQTYREEGFANRNFCKTCGSTLFAYQWPDGPMTVVPLGTLDDGAQFKPAMHINVAFKAPWHEITDELPQMEGMPG